MDPAANESPPQQDPVAANEWVAADDWPTHPEIETHERCNLLLLATHQIVLRVGWIFKTESVIMPAFLDSIAGAGWIRGFLPVLNRFGQSLPPVFCAGYLRVMRQKKLALAAFVVLMSLPFGLLSLAWLAGGSQNRVWMPWLFMALYGIFFVFNGLYHLSFGTVQGKLIRPARRGRLLLISTFYGSLPAMLAAWWLLDGWLKMPDGGYGYIFGFTSVCFLLSGLTVLLLSEPGDDPVARDPASEPKSSLSDTWAALRGDRNLRRLVTVAVLFGSSLIVFPHYQSLAREELGLTGTHLMIWVITQNAAVGVFSMFVGPLADAWGNRFTLRVLVFSSAVAPLLAAVLPQLAGGIGGQLFWIVFVALGVVPLVLRILANYALEICPSDEHPRYLSTVSLCLAIPFLFSPAIGWIVDLVGADVVFLATAALTIMGGLLTFRLDEPRHRVLGGKPGPVGAGGDE